MSNLNEELASIGKQLMFSEPFYGIFLSTLNKVERKDLPTAGVSLNGPNYQLSVNKEFWDSLNNDKKKIGLLKHELLHICFNHLHDREWFPDQELHNIAADIEINQHLTPEYYPTNDILLPTSFPELNLPLKAGTKVYYGLLSQAKESGASPTLNGLLKDIGDLEGGLHPTWKEMDGLSEADKKLVKAQLEHQIKNILENQSKQSNGRGFIPAELESFIEELLKDSEPTYDWKAYFRRFSSTSSKVYTKKTRRKPNKRFPGNPALKIKPKKKVLVGVDTSGSVGDKDLAEFFTEINHMYKSGVEITIAEGDAAINNIYEYNGIPPEKISGRGGTDMNPFITYFNEHPGFSSLIILTDGYIGNREVKSFKPTLLVLCSNGEEVEKVKENGWGQTIKINLASN